MESNVNDVLIGSSNTMTDRRRFMEVLEILSEENWEEECSTDEKNMLIDIVLRLLRRNFYHPINGADQFMDEEETQVLSSFLPDIARSLVDDYKNSSI